MSIKSRMYGPEAEYLAHLASDDGARDLMARGLKAVHLGLTLTPGTVSAGSVTVQGQVVDAFGNAVSGVKDVVLKSYAPTGTGNLTAAASPVGTIKKGSGTVEVWMQTNASGAFAIAVADATSEVALLKAEVGDGVNSTVQMQF